MLPGVELARRRRISYSDRSRSAARTSRETQLAVATALETLQARYTSQREDHAARKAAANEARMRLEARLRATSLRGVNGVRGDTRNVEARKLMPVNETRKPMLVTEEVYKKGNGGGELDVSECPICLETFLHGHDIVLKLPCRHSFHRQCVTKWVQTNGSCPYCRSHLTV